MDEQNAAILQLSKKQRADRQFLLSRLEAAFTKVAHLETEHNKLQEETQQLKDKLEEEKAISQTQAQLHRKELGDRQTQLDKVLERLDALENIISGNPYLAFSRAAHSPKAKDDPFNADFLAQSALNSEPSFAFAMPDVKSTAQSTPDLQKGSATTWDLLNIGDDLPPFSNAIRQSFLGDEQERAHAQWNGSASHLLGTSQSEPELRRAESITSSEYVPSSSHLQQAQPNDYRVMSTSSLPFLDEPANSSSSYPIAQPDHLGDQEAVSYPTIFEGSQPAAPVSPLEPEVSGPRYATTFTVQLNRRRGTIKSQKIRFDQMCEQEANNVEQEVVRSWVFEALGKAGEQLKNAEQCMEEADRADEYLGWVLHEDQGQEERIEAQRGAEFRATKARNVLESAYSRLCSALDRAVQQQNVLTVEQKTQRSGSSAMRSLKQLLGRKESEGTEGQAPEDPPAAPPPQREQPQRPLLGRTSGTKPSPGPHATSPLLNAVDRLNQVSISPQRLGRTEATAVPLHRRTMSDTPLFPPTPEPKAQAKGAESSRIEQQRNGRMSEAELMTLIGQLEERRLALYRN